MQIIRRLHLLVVFRPRVHSIAPYHHYRPSPSWKKLSNKEIMGEHFKGREDSILPSGIPASVVSVNILQNGSFGFSRSVYLATDHAVYLFNCPESNRRLFNEHGLRRIPLVQNIFFTHGGWENVGGLAGLAAFLREVKTKTLYLHGPPGLQRIINVARTFGDNPRVDFNEKPVLEDQGLDTYESSGVIIQCVPFTAPGKEAALREYLERKIESRDGHHPIRPDDVAVAYICQLKPKFGKILLDKCLERGIQIGPDIGKLQRGLAVKNRHGEEVHPDEVREPPLPPRFLAVVECPDQQFTNALIRAEAFHRFQADAKEELALMVHLTPSHVLETGDYREWMNRFPSSTNHWICNDSAPPICHLEGAYKAQIKMNSVHEEMFPLLWHHGLRTSTASTSADASGSISNAEVSDGSAPNDENGSASDANAAASTSKATSDNSTSPKPVTNIRLAEPFTKYSFRPPVGFERMRENEGFYDIEDEDEVVKYVSPKTVELERFKKEAAIARLSGDRFPIITFLGTAAAAPTKYRNISSIVLDLEDHVSIMMDCGESTTSQLRLLYGLDSADERLTDLKAVFITHLHLDHHFGLYSLILERKAAFEKLGKPYEKLIVLAATPLLRAHKDFSNIVEDITGLCEFHSTAVGDRLLESRRKICERVRLKDVDVVKVVHPQCATGFVVTTRDDKKIVYSGDTRPSDELIKRGMYADLLIHEATLNDGFERDAIYKKHCTKSEAIQVSKAMKAAFTILTHFTASNTKLPYMEEELIKANPTVGVSCDFMRIRWEQLELVPKLVPVIFEMHAFSIPEQAERSTKKRLEQMDSHEEETPSKAARVK